MRKLLLASGNFGETVREVENKNEEIMREVEKKDKKIPLLYIALILQIIHAINGPNVNNLSPPNSLDNLS